MKSNFVLTLSVICVIYTNVSLSAPPPRVDAKGDVNAANPPLQPVVNPPQQPVVNPPQQPAGNPPAAAQPFVNQPAGNLPPAAQPVRNQPTPAAGNQGQNTQAKREVDAVTIIADHPACSADVKRLCPQDPKEVAEDSNKVQHNFMVLECLMSVSPEDTLPSEACQTVVHQYKYRLTNDTRFEKAANEVCKDYVAKNKVEEHCTVKSPPGVWLTCLMEHAYDAEEDDKHTPCFKFLSRMEMVLFSDYHLVHDFLKDCEHDIQRKQCGRIYMKEQDEENPDQHGQGATIDCLMKDFQNLANSCKRQIVRVAELQADDYHLDRPLYFACKHDREKFCRAVKSGEGKVYQCLMENQKNKDMAPQCRAQLVKREQMIQEDAKVDKGFFVECKSTLEKYNCEVSGTPGNPVHMSAAVVCLRNADETAEDDKFSIPQGCLNELRTFQNLLLNDYHISPEVLHDCNDEINSYCKGLEKADRADGTIHCLMGLAMPSKDEKTHKKFDNTKLSNQCKVAMKDLIEEADPLENQDDLNLMDEFLMEQCQRELNNFCKEDENKIDCLINALDTGKIDRPNPCAIHLLELEYFVTRNYKLDRPFYKACRVDMEATNIQHPAKSADEQGADTSGLVFGQLWKLARQQLHGHATASHQISKPCVKELIRIKHQRSVSIDLNPELEEACLHHLTTYCQSAPDGEELACLQEHWAEIKEHVEKTNVDKNNRCVDLLAENIEDQDEDVGLDYMIMKSCEPALKKYCEEFLTGFEKGEVDNGEIVQCLIEHKHEPDMDNKCFAGIEHHQIVNMQSYNFNTKFREACKKDYESICVHKTNRVDVIRCLSEAVRNDTVLGVKQRISPFCRQQLTSEALQWEDAVQLDPDFKKKCSKTLKEHCTNLDLAHGEDATAAVLQCLRKVGLEKIHKQEPRCAKYIHEQVQDTNFVAGAGAMVFRACKRDIKKLCDNRKNPDQLMNCLDENYEDLSAKCQEALDQEEEEDNEDIRLNPALYVPCKDDIHTLCQSVLDENENEETLHGQVINCLKMEYVKGKKSKLSQTCSNQMHLLVVKVQTRDFKQDYVLTHECKKEISECSKNDAKEHDVIKCLKEKLFKGELKDDSKCQQEVFRLITESRVDIQTDKELHEVCAVEVSMSPCGNLPAGGGRVMTCLLGLYEGGKINDPQCKNIIRERKDLWARAAKISPPESLKDVWNDMSASNSRWYFFTIISSVILVILVIGVCCGRASKRIAAEAKNR